MTRVQIYSPSVSPSGNDEEDKQIDDTSNGSITVFGLLSWIAGIIIIIVYCKLDDETNGNSETLFNSFRAAIIMDMTLFALGLFIIVSMTLAAVWRILFRKKRFKTLFMFIFGLIIMTLATGFYAAIAFVGWKYVTGDCYNELTSFEPSSATIQLHFDSTAGQSTNEEDIKKILESSKMIPESYECMETIDCIGEKMICQENKCKLSESVVECVNDYDCGDVITNACSVNNTCVDGLSSLECVTRNQCQNGLDCLDGHCQEPKVSSALAFPKTFYNVKCTTSNRVDFECKMQYTVPTAKNKDSGLFTLFEHAEDYLIREVNARFQPANIDFVKTENEFYIKSELYAVEISRENIVDINGIDPESMITTTTEKTTTTDETTDGSGEGSGVESGYSTIAI